MLFLAAGRQLNSLTVNLLLGSVLLFAILANPAAAQSATPKTLAEFADTSAKAEGVLRNAPGSYSRDKIAALNDLRHELADFRDFADRLATKGTLESRLIDAQISRLGAPPTDGEIEAPIITARRDELYAAQSKILRPVLHWQEARVQAATLVGELDQRIKLLESRRLYSRTSTLVQPSTWAALANDYRALRLAFSSESSLGPMGWIALLVGLVVVIAVVIFGLMRAMGYLHRKFREKVEGTTNLAKQLGYVLLEDITTTVAYFIGTLAVLAGIIATLGQFLKAETVIGLLLACMVAGAVVALSHWLGMSLFRSPIPALRLISLKKSRRMKAAKYVTVLGAILALEAIPEMAEEVAAAGTTLGRAFSTILILAGSAIVWGFGSLLVTSSGEGEMASDDQADKAADDDNGNEVAFARPIGRVVKFLAVCAVVTALIGYVALAREIFVGTLLSLAVIGTAIYVQRSIRLIMGALMQGPLRPYRSVLRFLPLLTGFALLMLTLFLIALVWGYKYEEISDVINMLRVGVEFGDIRLSAGDVFTFGLVFIIGFAATRWVQQYLRVSVMPDFDIERGAQSALITGLGYIGVMLSAVVAIASTGLDLSSLAYVAGALSVGLGFGLQSVVENFVSGIILLVERPVREGDWIEVDGYSGIVRKIAVRSTQIETFDRHFVVVPNSKIITGNVKNFSFGGDVARIIVEVGVAYGTDLAKAKELLLDIARSHEAVLPDPEPNVALDSFGDSSLNLKLLCFVADPTKGNGVVSEINFEIARRFAEQEIEIPFPQQDVHIRSGLQASGQVAPA